MRCARVLHELLQRPVLVQVVPDPLGAGQNASMGVFPSAVEPPLPPALVEGDALCKSVGDAVLQAERPPYGENNALPLVVDDNAVRVFHNAATNQSVVGMREFG